MKVFISWSGEPSKTVALALRDWLPSVIQAVRPWMSASDIEPGTRWNAKIVEELNVTTFGIICLTRSNLTSSWILFEAGALAKTIEHTYVVPYLIGGLRSSDIEQPLGQFQSKVADRDGTWALVNTINNRTEPLIPDAQLKMTFDLWWPKLEEVLTKLPDEGAQMTPKRTEKDMLEEVLDLVRGLVRAQDIMGDIPVEPIAKAKPFYVERFRRDARLQQFLTMLNPDDRLSFIHDYVMQNAPELKGKYAHSVARAVLNRFTDTFKDIATLDEWLRQEKEKSSNS